MYRPYPERTEMRQPQLRAAPAAVRIAAWLMYLGAAVSLIRVIADVVTRSELKALLISHGKAAPVHPTASQLAAAANASLGFALAVGVISIGLWIFIARATRNGSSGARVTGLVLFGLDTLALLAGPSDLGLTGAQPALARFCTGIVWLVGLAVVILALAGRFRRLLQASARVMGPAGEPVSRQSTLSPSRRAGSRYLRAQSSARFIIFVHDETRN
jgi:hypothetical protein